jgi:hypothetical protein
VHAIRTGLGPEAAAQKIAALARQRAVDRNQQTPFSTAAQDAGYRYYGGKLDDITVVVSYITNSANMWFCLLLHGYTVHWRGLNAISSEFLMRNHVEEVLYNGALCSFYHLSFDECSFAFPFSSLLSHEYFINDRKVLRNCRRMLIASSHTHIRFFQKQVISIYQNCLWITVANDWARNFWSTFSILVQVPA